MELVGQEGLKGLFSYFCPLMNLEVPTKSTLDLTMGNTADICVGASVNGVMKSPKRYDYASSAELGFGLKRVLMILEKNPTPCSSMMVVLINDVCP